MHAREVLDQASYILSFAYGLNVPSVCFLTIFNVLIVFLVQQATLGLVKCPTVKAKAIDGNMQA